MPSRLQGAVRIRPVASPVDRSVDQRGRVSSALQLAEALKDFAPEAARAAMLIREHQEAKDAEQGEADALKAFDFNGNLITEGDATRKGLIPKDKSGSYRRAFAKVLGQKLGQQYSVGLQAFIAQTLSDVTDTDKAAEMAAEWDRKWREEHIPADLDDHARVAFERNIGEARVNAMRQAVAVVSSNYVKKTEEDLKGLAQMTAFSAFSSTDPPESQARSLQIGFEQIARDAYAAGMEGNKVNSLMVDGAITAAVEGGAPEIIEAVRNVKTGSGALLGDTPEFAARLRSAEVRAYERKRTRWQTERDARQQQIDSLRNAAIDKVMNAPDPETVDVSEEYNALRKIDPDAARALNADIAGARQIREGATATTPNSAMLAQFRADPANARRILTDAAASGYITREQYRKLSPAATAYQSSAKGASRSSAAGALSRTLRYLGNAVRGQAFDTAETSEILADFEAEAWEHILGAWSNLDATDLGVKLRALADEYRHGIPKHDKSTTSQPKSEDSGK